MAIGRVATRDPVHDSLRNVAMEKRDSNCSRDCHFTSYIVHRRTRSRSTGSRSVRRKTETQENGIFCPEKILCSFVFFFITNRQLSYRSRARTGFIAGPIRTETVGGEKNKGNLASFFFVCLCVQLGASLVSFALVFSLCFFVLFFSATFQYQ